MKTPLPVCAPSSPGTRARRRLVLLASLSLVGCTDTAVPDPVLPSAPLLEVSGSVLDEDGNGYPNVAVRLRSAANVHQARTLPNGEFRVVGLTEGAYAVEFDPPRATMAITAPSTVQVSSAAIDPITLLVRPSPRPARVNVGSIDVFGEIRNAQDQVPTSGAETLFARNVFDPPLGLLTPITSPVNSQLTLTQWEGASGEVLVTCAGNTANVTILLEGLVPLGTYSFWLNFLRTPLGPGDPINVVTDIVRIEPLKSGSDNVVTADAQGRVATTLAHAGCILTQEAGLVLPVVYHINGNTFGAEHIPDPEEATHLLVYFQ